jgi:superkiller protein 3
LEPENVVALVYMASVHSARGEVDQALELLDKALAKQPDDALGLYLRARLRAERNDAAHALPDAERVVALEPENTRGRLLLATILVREGRCPAAAEQLEKVIAAEPANSEALSLLARAYQCAGRGEEAVAARKRFAELAKGDHTQREGGVRADHLVREARKLAQEGQPNAALLRLKEALDLDPENDGAYTQLAKIHFSAGRYEIAREAAERALQHNPYQSDALYVLGRALAKLNDNAGARDALVQATLVNPLDAEAFWVLGQIYDLLGDRTNGLEAFEKAVALEPGNEDYARSLELLKRKP